MNPQARIWKHELFSVRSIAFISTAVNSPDEACIKYAAFCTWPWRECYIGGLVSFVTLGTQEPRVRIIQRNTGKWWQDHYIDHFNFDKMIARGFWKLSQFSKRVTYKNKNAYVHFWHNTHVRTRELTIFMESRCHVCVYIYILFSILDLFPNRTSDTCKI